ncbi:hypothetical protein A2765_00845 [Candidatus Kaiserbacteria bacterium RIFCSPHIGHO2_01_FULL_56_24]|uniref:SHS2 domain-containing protein n=1 Tax=Candidatus Kaiserbacteria bacterium RIFCSPHIGHO2_01_FULL_56_24 TaxID=1798487 RepID=A0A1F6DEZ4_9BACT|nr:MAG: hypothetical protein A2765_00845 [Candidatus Kaiserbacteria bacterium RIFCSPHIGHO2_01_FULL_56_24]
MFSVSRLQGKPVFIADIGDGSVGAALVTLGKGAAAEVRNSIRATLPFEDRAPEQSAAAILQLLETTIGKLMSADSGKKSNPPHALHVILRAPWTRFRTTQAEESFSEPRAITKDLIAQLAKKALAAPSELDRGNISEAGVMQVFLNGYPTGEPLGKRAKSIGLVAFESDIDAAMKTGIISVLGKAFPGRTPVIRSGMRAILTVMQEHLPDVHRFLLLDIGGSVSSCAIIRKESMTQYGAAPEGLSTILKRVAPSGLPEETLSMLRMLATDACSTTACQSLKDSLARAEPDLVRAFGEVFAKLAATRRLPNAALLSAPAELTPWLQGFFSRIDFSQFTATTQPLSVETLSPEHMLDTVHWTPGISPDTGIGISASSVNILEQSA